MTASSLNHVFRLVWSDRLGGFVAVMEHARAGGRSRALRLTALAAALAASGGAMAAGLPTGGQIAAGSGSIAQSGNTLTVTQGSARLVANWQSFDIGAGSTVQFVQPSASAVALNRVLGADVSVIQGALRANGRVFLLNPNGVLFTPTARVDTGGLVASTLAMSDSDFMAGRERLQGGSGAEVRNQGQLRADGGLVALIAAKVVNEGEIDARAGQALLAAGSDVTLDVGAPVKLRVNRGALDALVDNGGAIRADGGTVLLTAKSLDQLSTSLVRNTGEVRARTLATGEKGEILLLGDMGNGRLEAGGRLDASAPAGGDGGHIETSAARVDNAASLAVDAGSRAGLAGSWLIDPYDYTINAAAAANIAAALNTGTNVTVSTQSSVAGYGGGASGSGDISVTSAIAKTAGGNATLTLQADRSITVGGAITSTAGQLGIKLSAANNAASASGGVAVNANLASNGGRILIGGAGGSVTSAQAYGIGYALNPTSSTAAVTLGTNVSIASGGGDITINGRTSATTNTYDGTKAGIYVLSGATVNTGGGNLYMSAVSTGSAKEFAFNVEANSNTVTTFRTSSTTGGIFVDVNNTLDALGSLGLVNNGSQARVQFWAPSVAHMLFRLNGSNQAATFTQSPPCNPGYPNCGTMVIPGGNQSYTSAGYNVVSMAMNPLYVFTGSGTRTYDGSTDASNVAVSFLGGPGGFSLANLGTLSFSTPSKNVDTYTSLTAGAGNPTSYANGSYAVAYFSQGSYTITPKALSSFQAANKTYDGTTAAAVSASGVVAGDNLTINATGGFTSAGVGTGIGVSITGVSLSGSDAGNYSLPAFSTINTTADITRAPLTVTAANATKTYDANAYAGGNGVTYTGLVNGETAAVLGGSLSFGGSSQGAVNAGSYAITPSGLTSGNYQISFANGSLTVNPATLTYTATPASRVYGAANPVLGGSVTGLVGGDSLATATTGTASFTTAASATSGVGSYAVTGSGLTAASGNYVFAQAAGNATALAVTPAPLTVTANAAAKTYDGQAYGGGNGVTYTGFANGETAAVLGGSLSFGGSSQGAVNAGSYALVPQGLSASNYALSYVGSTLTVNPATLTVAVNPASRSYGAANPAFSAVVTGLVNGETLAAATTGSLSFSTAAGAGSGVGSYGVSATGLSANHGNYTIVQAPANTTALTVVPASLTVTANGDQRTYDGNAYSGGNGVAYSGFVNGETSAVLGGALSYGGSSQGAVNAGSYAITPSGLTAANYAISYVSGSLSISPAVLAVITGSLTGSAAKVYDGSTAATLAPSNYLLSGFVGGDGATVTQTRGSYADANAGANKTVTVALAASDFSPTGSTSLSNYTLPTSVSGNIGTITPAPLLIAARNATKTYDGSIATTATPMVTGLLGSDTVTGLAEAFADRNAGSGKALVVTGYTLNDGNGGANYSVTLAGSHGGLIERASASIAAVAGSVTYNGATQQQAAPVATGFLAGDAIAIAGAASGRNAGSYRSALSVSGADAGNYNVSVHDADLTITRAPLTLTASAATKTYDGSTATTATPMVTGLLGSDTVTSLAEAFADRNAGSGKALAVTGYTVNDGNGGGNYEATLRSSTAGAIAPATLTLSVAPVSRSAGVANPAFTASVAGFVGGDTLATATTGALSFTTPADLSSQPGRYGVTAGGLVAQQGNYVFAQAPGNQGALTVTAAPVAAEQYLPKTAPVPNFPDNAVPALGNTPAAASPSSLNYVAVAAPAPSVTSGTAAAQPVANAATVPQPGAASEAGAGSALVAERSAAAPARVEAAPAVSTLALASAPSVNDVATTTPPLGITAGAAPQPGAVAEAGSFVIADRPAAAPSRAEATSPVGDAPAAAPAARIARVGVANVAVSSANGPLDIYVVDGGVNVRGERAPASR